MKRIDVLYCSDLIYLEWSIISAASVAVFTMNVELHLHLFALNIDESKLSRWHSVLKAINPTCITHVHSVSDVMFQGLPTWRGGYGTFLRMLAPQLINADWVLYLDGDTLALRSVETLWSLKEDRFWFMGHLNPSARHAEVGYGIIDVKSLKEKYLNAGVLMMNLKLLRENNFDALWKDVLSEMDSPPRFPDQTLLNLISVYKQDYDKRGILPNEWGCYSREGDKLEQLGESIALIHYASDAPWVKKCEVRDVDVLWYKFVERILVSLGEDSPLFKRRFRGSVFARLRFLILSRVPSRIWSFLRSLTGPVELEVHRGRLPYAKIMSKWDVY